MIKCNVSIIREAAEMARYGMCEGSCDNHIGDTVVVRVKDNETGFDWGEFSYCEAAIEEDKRRGLSVEIINH